MYSHPSHEIVDGNMGFTYTVYEALDDDEFVDATGFVRLSFFHSVRTLQSHEQMYAQ